MKKRVVIEFSVFLLILIGTVLLIILTSELTSENRFRITVTEIKFEITPKLFIVYSFSLVTFIVYFLRQTFYKFKRRLINWVLLLSALVLIYATEKRFKSISRLENAFQLDKSPIPEELMDFKFHMILLGLIFLTGAVITIFFIGRDLKNWLSDKI